MRRPRSYLPEKLEPGGEIDLPREIVHHLVQVLRMKEGQEIILFNGEDGRDYLARLLETGKRKARARILSRGEAETRPALRIHLGLGISRGERMDLAIQKAVELGVWSITPLRTERTQAKYSPERLNKRQEHWKKVIISACEQSGRRYLPDMAPACQPGDWLKKQAGPVLLLDPGEDRCLRDIPPPSGDLGLLVGPEGGFSGRERQLARDYACLGIRLGPRVLRTETAPLATIAAIQALWGDFC